MLVAAAQWDVLRSQHLSKELNRAAMEAAVSLSPETEIECEEHEMVVHVLAMAMLLGSVTAKTTLICQKPGQNHPKNHCPSDSEPSDSTEGVSTLRIFSVRWSINVEQYAN